MFCTKCGAKIEDGAKFCVQCGNKTEGDIPRIKPTGVIKKSGERQPRKKFMLSDLRPKEQIKVFPIILFVVLLAAVIIFPKFILSGNEERKIAKNFIDAELTGDAEKILGFIPDKLVEEMLQEMGANRSELIEELDKAISEAHKTVNDVLGEDWSYSCKINSIESVEGAAFNDIIEDYAEIIDDMGISEAAKAEVEVSVSGKDVDNSIELEIPMIKIDNKWYLDFANIDLSSFGVNSLF